MSKTPKAFKSSLMGKESRLVIEPSKVLASESFYITHETVLGEKSFNFHNTEAPAIALAILEAAGYTIVEREDEAKSHIADGMYSLTNAIEVMSADAAEAEAQAKLEAEALELVNAWMDSCGAGKYPSWAHVETGRREQGLAVARRAREINKENQ